MNRVDEDILTYKKKGASTAAVKVDKWPDTCPSCKQGVEPMIIDAFGKEFEDFGGENIYVQLISQCPKVDCQAIFIAYYTSVGGKSYGAPYVFLRDVYIRPYTKKETFDKSIEKLSPNFVKIYNQAKTADDSGLDQICGPGYRKALEFLIKSFLIKTKSKQKDKIKASSLGWLIYNMVDSQKIITTAGLAKDVGNDETHFEKELDGLTVEDLRILVKLTVHWVEDELATSAYAKVKK